MNSRYDGAVGTGDDIAVTELAGVTFASPSCEPGAGLC